MPRTHDIGQLLLTLADASLGPPPHADYLDALNPYAVAGRYGALDPGELDRITIGTWLDDVLDWAANHRAA